jgi:hypothetical protein
VAVSLGPSAALRTSPVDLLPGRPIPSARAAGGVLVSSPVLAVLRLLTVAYRQKKITTTTTARHWPDSCPLATGWRLVGDARGPSANAVRL